jgi:hypothetical protein
MKTSKILTLLAIVFGTGLFAGAPVAYAAHAATSNVAITGYGLGQPGHNVYLPPTHGHFTVHGKSKHSVVKSKEPKHYRICSQAGSGPMLVTYDGQTAIIEAFNCSDFTASSIDVEGVDGASVSATYHQPDHITRFTGHQ